MLSNALMKRAAYSEVENKIWNQRGYSSGDSAFTDVIWDKMRILPTDPGMASPAADYACHLLDWPGLIYPKPTASAVVHMCSQMLW